MSAVAASRDRLVDWPGDDVVAHLERARALVAREGVWTQDAYARDDAAAAVDSGSPEAARFCCAGALFATQASHAEAVASRAVLSAAIGTDIEVWNDMPGRRQQDVLAAFDRALACAEDARRRG